MLLIAHRGSMTRGLQNSPEGIHLASRQGVDGVELDVTCGRDGRFRCVHGLGRGTALEDCLAAMDGIHRLIIHLKGFFSSLDLSKLAGLLADQIPHTKIVFAAHRGEVLRRLRTVVTDACLARFGVFPALLALWRQPVWQIALVNQIVLWPGFVRALQARGFIVYASCVWEVRSRTAVSRLGVDGAFVNLR